MLRKQRPPIPIALERATPAMAFLFKDTLPRVLKAFFVFNLAMVTLLAPARHKQDSGEKCGDEDASRIPSSSVDHGQRHQCTCSALLSPSRSRHCLPVGNGYTPARWW